MLALLNVDFTELQSVTLIASCLKVPLRYPLRLGGSHSYILDRASSIETATGETSACAASPSDLKPAEFPLFLEGQDTTRAAYAVFLLNKVSIMLLALSFLFGRRFLLFIYK